MHKTGKPLFTWIPDWLMERLQVRRQKIGSMIFAVGESTRLETVTDLWRRKLGRLGWHTGGTHRPWIRSAYQIGG